MKILRSHRSRGSVLIISIVILAILTILAVAFARLMSVERDVSHQYRAKVQARMLAVAGIEQAVASLQRDVARGDFAELGQNAWPNATLVGLRDSGAVSFGDSTRHVSGIPYSGSLPLSVDDEGLSDTGLQYQLRVVDTSQLVNLTELQGHGEGVVRLLNNIGALLEAGFDVTVLERSPGSPETVAPTSRTFRFTTLDDRLGTLLEAGSTGGAYRSFEEVREALRLAYGTDIDDDLRLLERLVTFHGVTDPATVSPALGSPVGSAALLSATVEHRRAPINVNRAGRLILAAALFGLRAEYRYFDQATARSNGTFKFDGVAEIDQADALRIADAIIAYREGRGAGYPTPTHLVTNPIETWEELEGIIYRLADAGTITWAEADAVLANANPDPRLVKFNPDVYARYRPTGPDFDTGWVPPTDGGDEHRWAANRIWIDKADLRQYTTEFSLESPGIFDIESIGRVVLRDGTILASHRIRTVMRVSHELRFRTQEQFQRYGVPAGIDNVAMGPESINPGGGIGQNVSDTAGTLKLDDGYFDDGHRFALAQPGSFKTRTVPVADTKETYVYTGGTPERVTALPNASAGGSVFEGGNRVADGVLIRNSPDERFLKYDSDIVQGEGAVSFWVKMDEETLQRPGVGLFFSTNPIAGASDKAVQRLVYLHEGTLRVNTTYCSMRASVPSSVARTEVSQSYTGELREDAEQRLINEGAEWLRARKPGAAESYYRAFGEHYARQVLTALAQGESQTSIVRTYIYDAERVEGLGHLGCITKVTPISDTIEAVFKPGTWEIETVTKSTEAYLAAVNETAKFNYQFNSSMGVSNNSQANQLLNEAQTLTGQAESLENQARAKQDQASQLESDANDLLQDAGTLRAEADSLDAQADALQDLLDDDDPDNDPSPGQITSKRNQANAKRNQATTKENQAANKLSQANDRRNEANALNESAIEKLSDAAGKIETAAELANDDASGLLADYERVTSKGLENPNRFSRVEYWTREPRDFRPGEWHHIYIGWNDELNNGEYTILIDNQTPTFERRDVWGPLDVWGSRQVQLRNDFFPGAFTLRRASGEAGRNESIGGLEPKLAGAMTLNDFRLYDSFVSNPALMGRYNPDDSVYAMQFRLDDLTEWEAIQVPRSWQLSGTVHVRGRFPKLGRTDGLDPTPMVGTTVQVNGTGAANNRLPLGTLARDGSGAYQTIRTDILFSQVSTSGPFAADDVREATYQMHTPVIDEVIFRFVVPPTPQVWEETDRIDG